MKELAHIDITPGDGTLSSLYKELGESYPKFYKMDNLSKLGYIASEKLLRSLQEERFVEREDRAILLLSQHGCMDCDRKYQDTLTGAEGYFPSPSLFVYSLPNIVAGEIAIRNHYVGESQFHLLDRYTERTIRQLVEVCFQDPVTTSVLCGWLDYVDDTHYEAHFKLYEK